MKKMTWLLLLLLASLAAAALADMSIVGYGGRSEEEVRRLYHAWKAHHGKPSGALAASEEEDPRYVPRLTNTNPLSPSLLLPSWHQAFSSLLLLPCVM